MPTLSINSCLSNLPCLTDILSSEKKKSYITTLISSAQVSPKLPGTIKYLAELLRDHDRVNIETRLCILMFLFVEVLKQVEARNATYVVKIKPENITIDENLLPVLKVRSEKATNIKRTNTAHPIAKNKLEIYFWAKSFFFCLFGPKKSPRSLKSKGLLLHYTKLVKNLRKNLKKHEKTLNLMLEQLSEKISSSVSGLLLTPEIQKFSKFTTNEDAMNNYRSIIKSICSGPIRTDRL